ncbi:hypothetical protein NDU88_002580 [Pleurodeles waltl]|uniref:Uncharacterized protein n=1 Tax=Pleurodeles waltl TaxID=8319 RepID=A0AAV7TM19_PLEWA|nr:hypothetical protein NDU88_002580 [Pleurodeles waltl]
MVLHALRTEYRVAGCSRLSSNTAPASEWRCSRGREISVTRCPDDQEAGVGAMTPDFQVPGTLKSEDGLERASEEPDAADQDAEETTEAESGNREETEKRPGSQSSSYHLPTVTQGFLGSLLDSLLQDSLYCSHSVYSR